MIRQLRQIDEASLHLDSQCYAAWTAGRDFALERGRPLIRAGLTDLDVLFGRLLEFVRDVPRGAGTTGDPSVEESYLEGMGHGAEYLITVGTESH